MICSILFNTPSYIICLFLLVFIFLFYILGTVVGYHQKQKRPEAKADGVGPLENALLGLLALLLSFTFSMSSSRHDKRTSLAIQEANDISTAILRADLYPDSIRIFFRNDLKLYVESRIAYNEAGLHENKISQSLDDVERISARIWATAANATRNSNLVMPHSVMAPALNSMIDAVTSREAARVARVPDLIMWLLIILNLLGSFTIGYAKNEKQKDWIILSIYAIMTVATIFAIMDLDRPSRGIITTKEYTDKIAELRKML
jgi:hypothetical protein